MHIDRYERGVNNIYIFFSPDPNTEVPSIRLIDFGCAIDMNCFDEKTQFKKVFIRQIDKMWIYF